MELRTLQTWFKVMHIPTDELRFEMIEDILKKYPHCGYDRSVKPKVWDKWSVPISLMDNHSGRGSNQARNVAKNNALGLPYVYNLLPDFVESVSTSGIYYIMLDNHDGGEYEIIYIGQSDTGIASDLGENNYKRRGRAGMWARRSDFRSSATSLGNREAIYQQANAVRFINTYGRERLIDVYHKFHPCPAQYCKEAEGDHLQMFFEEYGTIPKIQDESDAKRVCGNLIKFFC